MPRRSIRTATALLALAIAPATLPPAARAQSSGALPPAIGRPLERARELLARHNYAGAMAQVRAADNVRGKSNDAQFVIDEMRGSIAQASGDHQAALATYEQLLASGRVHGADEQRLLLAIASMSYQDKDYAKAINAIDRYQRAGGRDPSIETLAIQSHYLNRDYAGAAKLESAAVAGEQAHKQAPTEAQLQLLAASDQQDGDHDGFVHAMQMLVRYYPKPDYWANLIHGVATKPGFADRLQLDLDRLRLATGNMTTASEFTNAAELALVADEPGLAKRFLDQGFTNGVLGTGPEAARQQKLRALIDKTLAAQPQAIATANNEARSTHDGNALAQIGEEYATSGDPARGVAFLQAGIARGGLRNPDDATLHLGLAQAQAGQLQEAQRTLASVHGTDGTADLAQLWLLRFEHAAPS